MDTPTRRAIARFWRSYLLCLVITGLIVAGCLA